MDEKLEPNGVITFPAMTREEANAFKAGWHLRGQLTEQGLTHLEIHLNIRSSGLFSRSTEKVTFDPVVPALPNQEEK